VLQEMLFMLQPLFIAGAEVVFQRQGFLMDEGIKEEVEGVEELQSLLMNIEMVFYRSNQNALVIMAKALCRMRSKQADPPLDRKLHPSLLWFPA